MARSVLELTACVLGAVDQGKHKYTHIMYAVNVSGTALGPILAHLAKLGMVKVDRMGRSHRYFVTPLGHRTLEKWNNVVASFDMVKPEEWQ